MDAGSSGDKPEGWDADQRTQDSSNMQLTTTDDAGGRDYFAMIPAELLDLICEMAVDYRGPVACERTPTVLSLVVLCRRFSNANRERLYTTVDFDQIPFLRNISVRLKLLQRTFRQNPELRRVCRRLVLRLSVDPMQIKPMADQEAQVEEISDHFLEHKLSLGFYWLEHLVLDEPSVSLVQWRLSIDSLVNLHTLEIRTHAATYTAFQVKSCSVIQQLRRLLISGSGIWERGHGHWNSSAERKGSQKERGRLAEIYLDDVEYSFLKISKLLDLSSGLERLTFLDDSVRYNHSPLMPFLMPHLSTIRYLHLSAELFRSLDLAKFQALEHLSIGIPKFGRGITPLQTYPFWYTLGPKVSALTFDCRATFRVINHPIACCTLEYFMTAALHVATNAVQGNCPLREIRFLVNRWNHDNLSDRFSFISTHVSGGFKWGMFVESSRY